MGERSENGDLDPEELQPGRWMWQPRPGANGFNSKQIIMKPSKRFVKMLTASVRSGHLINSLPVSASFSLREEKRKIQNNKLDGWGQPAYDNSDRDNNNNCSHIIGSGL